MPKQQFYDIQGGVFVTLRERRFSVSRALPQKWAATLRKSAGLTEKKAANLMNVPISSYLAWEYGEGLIPLSQSNRIYNFYGDLEVKLRPKNVNPKDFGL